MNKAKKYYEIASSLNNIDATIQLIYIYANDYLETREENTLTKIKELVRKVETSPLYNGNLKIKIEETLRKIKDHKSIDLDIITNIYKISLLS